MDDFSGFLKTVPIGLLLAPLFFLGLYAILMFYIIQRGAARRRQRRVEKEQLMAQMNGTSKPTASASVAKPIKPVHSNAQRRPAPMAEPASATAISVPEPDFDLLTGLSFMAAPVRSNPARVPPQVESPLEGYLIPLPSDLPGQSDESDLPDQIVEINAMPVGSSAATQSESNAPADSVEVMRIWRDINDGSLIIQMGGQRYRTMNEIDNSDLARRFSTVVRELWTMVSNAGKTVAPSPEAAALLGTEANKPRLGLLNQTADELPARPGLMRQFGRAALGQPAAAKTEPPAQGIANLIEEFLQFKLSEHPEFRMRSIHIRPAFDGGVRIEVDGKSFDGIGEITDVPAREFLLGVMKEWEARQ